MADEAVTGIRAPHTFRLYAIAGLLRLRRRRPVARLGLALEASHFEQHQRRAMESIANLRIRDGLGVCRIAAKVVQAAHDVRAKKMPAILRGLWRFGTQEAVHVLVSVSESQMASPLR
jgi:hypothetical protein